MEQQRYTPHYLLRMLVRRRSNSSLVTFVGAERVVLTGATPVFADIDKDTYCLKIESVEECVSRKTKAIIPQISTAFLRISGMMNLRRGKELSSLRTQPGSRRPVRWEKIGSIADMTCFSFYAGKKLQPGRRNDNNQ